MENIIFSPISNNPKSTLEQFITFYKQKLTAFDQDCWIQNQWKTMLSINTVQARFSTDRISSTSYQYEPLAYPFIEFAKWYIRYTYSIRPIRQLSRHMEVLRIAEMTLYKS